MEANIAEFDRHHAGDGAAWQRQFEEFMANADLSFGVLGTELWSTAGFSLGSSMLRRFGRRGLLAYAGSALATCRDWTTRDLRRRSARTGCSRRGSSTPGSGPTTPSRGS